MGRQEQRKHLPTCQAGLLFIYRRGITRLYIAKFFAIGLVLVFIFISVNFSNATVTRDSRHKPEKARPIYILMWTPHSRSPFSFWSTGRKDVLQIKCPVTNCYLTTRRDYFRGDIKQYDAIVFNGRDIRNYKKSDLPKKRSVDQIYIFVNIESSDNQPIFNPIFDNFFNWTATYKLNSDINLSYFTIKEKSGRVIGPMYDTPDLWMDFDQMYEVDNSFKRMLRKKSKAVAWFVSHCRTRSRRENYANQLQAALWGRNLTLDVIGRCGPIKCPRRNHQKCLDYLKRDYHFYLSFESSIAEDYVTEKVLNSLLADTAPVVYGGANYSRYLPPGSYLDATQYTPQKLAERIAHLIATPAEYEKMFRWKNHYIYEKTLASEQVCELCGALNFQERNGFRKVYTHFRQWWNADFVKHLAIFVGHQKRAPLFEKKGRRVLKKRAIKI